MHKVRRANLRKLIDDKYGGSVAEFSRFSEIDPARLSQVLSENYREGKNFGEKAARLIETKAHLPVFFLDETGEAPELEDPDEKFDLVPQLDMSAACGDGKFAEHVVVKGGLAFKKSFMRQFGISEATGRVIYADGSSMEPTIGNGRVVLVNLSDTAPQDGRVFLICDQDGALILKRLVREYDPTIQLTVWKTRSDNPDKRQFPDKILPMDSRVKIVGRAIWHDGLL